MLRSLFGLLLLFSAISTAQTYTVSTVGGGNPFVGDGGQATEAFFDLSSGLTYAPNGDLLITDYHQCRVRRINAAGIIATIAGNGSCGPIVEGASALLTPLPSLDHIVSDSAGNLFVSTNEDGHKVLRITAAGTVSTFAGTGQSGFSGDNGPAAAAKLDTPTRLAFDAAGNLYVNDSRNFRIRKITPQGIISTFAGNGNPDSTGDNGPATAASFYAGGMAFDRDGNLLIGDISSYKAGGRLRRITPAGVITTIAGKETSERGGDGGQALQAGFYAIDAIAVDSSRNIYIAEYPGWIRRIAPNGIVTNVAGKGYAGDVKEGPVATATFDSILDLIVKPGGGLLAAELGTPGRIFEVTTQNAIRTVAGGKYRLGESSRNSRFPLEVVGSLAQDSSGNIYLADELHLFRIRPNGIFETVQNFPSTFRDPQVVIDPQSRVYVTNLNIIWRWTPQSFELVLGNTAGTTAPCPTNLSGLTAVGANTCYLQGFAFAPDGTLYFTDIVFNRVYKVVNGKIQLVAGNGSFSHGGDGGQATETNLLGPGSIALDKDSNVFFSEDVWIRKVRPNGIIETIAGNGSFGDVVDGALATAAPIGLTGGLGISSQGDLYAASAYSLFKIGSDNRIRTVIRPTAEGLTGNGVLSAQLKEMGSFFVAPDGKILLLQEGAVRRLTPNTGTTCSYTLSTRAMERTAAGSRDVVSIATNAGCNWTANSNAPWLSIMNATNGTGSGTLYFDVAGYSGAAPRVGTITIAGQTLSVLQKGTAEPAFAIRYGDVIDGAAYAFSISPNAFAAVKPKGLPVTTTLPWDNAVPDGVTLPILLNGVGIKLDGKNAAISYTSPTQINFLVPSDLAPGTVLMELTAKGQTAYAVVRVEPYAPGFFAFPVNGRLNAIAQVAGTTTLIGSAQELPNVARPAKPGEFLQLYVNGLGGTAAVPPGKILSQVYPVLDMSRVRVWIAGVPCEVQFAGAINSGLFQVNIKVPTGIPSGFQPILLAFDEAGSQIGAGLWMQ